MQPSKGKHAMRSCCDVQVGQISVDRDNGAAVLINRLDVGHDCRAYRVSMSIASVEGGRCDDDPQLSKLDSLPQHRTCGHVLGPGKKARTTSTTSRELVQQLLATRVEDVAAAAVAAGAHLALAPYLSSLSAVLQKHLPTAADASDEDDEEEEDCQDLTEFIVLKKPVRVQNEQDPRNNECSADFSATFLVGPNQIPVSVGSTHRDVDSDKEITAECDFWTMEEELWEMDLAAATWSAAKFGDYAI